MVNFSASQRLSWSTLCLCHTAHSPVGGQVHGSSCRRTPFARAFGGRPEEKLPAARVRSSPTASRLSVRCGRHALARKPGNLVRCWHCAVLRVRLLNEVFKRTFSTSARSQVGVVHELGRHVHTYRRSVLRAHMPCTFDRSCRYRWLFIVLSQYSFVNFHRQADVARRRAD
jgi:hypothetical protein